MLCKFCGYETIELDRVNNPGQEEMYRRVVCPECGHVFYTCEFPIEIDNRLKKEWQTNHKDHAKIIGKEYYTQAGVEKLIEKLHRRRAQEKKE